WRTLAREGRLLGGTPVELDGSTVLKIENTNDTPLQLSLVKIDAPPITSITYALSGEIKYENVQGDGFLEMWSCFPPAQAGSAELKAFSRTVDDTGPMGKIRGTSSWRDFSLPFNRTGTTSAPSRLEVNIMLPGRGLVFIG